MKVTFEVFVVHSRDGDFEVFVEVVLWVEVVGDDVR